MIGWILQVSIISIVLILLIHYLINYVKNTFTVPKIKDLVNEPTQKYQEMYNIINNSSKKSDEVLNNDCTLIDSLPSDELEVEEQNVGNTDERIDMKNELKNFLKSQI